MRMPVFVLLCLCWCLPLHGAVESAGIVLRAGDVIRVRVHDNADLDLDLAIPASGSIPMPLIGEVVFAERNPEQISLEIRRRLENGYLRRADVTVGVVDARRPVFILGAIRTPGSVLIGTSPLSAMQAVAASGGFTENADRARARVIRDDPNSPGGKTTLPLPIDDGPEALAKDPRLQPNDTIVVPGRDRIYVLGQVVKPGAVDAPAQGRLTASRAIAQSGGFDRFARQREVLLLRAGAKPVTLDLESILTGKSEDPELSPGDSLVVPASRF